MEKSDVSLRHWKQLPNVWHVSQNLTWVIPEILVEGSLTMFAAKSGTGKSWLAYAIAGAIARGTEFAGRPAIQKPVLYIDGENPIFVTTRNLQDLGVQETDLFTSLGSLGGRRT
jgi:RecA-family ATPase